MTGTSQVAAALGSRRVRAGVRAIGGAVVLAAVVWRVGAEPFARGLHGVNAASVALALGLIFAATAASAWRWRVIARRLGARIALPDAIAMYYRSQFLNAVLPGGVLGDVHRAVAHGVEAGGIAAAARAVAIERLTGQLALAATAVALVAWTAPAFGPAVLTALAIAAAVVSIGLGAAALRPSGRRVIRRESAQLRIALGSPGAAAQVAASSAIVLVCHVAVFAVAATAVGAHLPLPQLIALSSVALLGAAIPANVGGWGPREGAAGWAFHAAGLGASAGVAASTAFGLLVLLAVAPGAIVTVVSLARDRLPHPAHGGRRERAS